ncbi:carboxypeptidase-like regulatory domain-containing protein, partial [bacterium]|nr:carboxypeptidase-like regulatory domain-containing protein [bacterium]
MKRSIIFLFALLAFSMVYAQTPTQTIRGTVTDLETTISLEGATIILLDSDPVRGTLTDSKGVFKLPNVALGRQSIRITYVGYEEAVIPAILVTSGKEVVLAVELTEAITTTDEVVIEAGQEKDLALNEMTTVSARTFDLEQTMRYAGGRNDPSRM